MSLFISNKKSVLKNFLQSGNCKVEIVDSAGQCPKLVASGMVNCQYKK